MSHFRTITAVVEVEDGSNLASPGFAMVRARDAIEAGGFAVVAVRNEHNDDGDLPPASEESTHG